MVILHPKSSGWVIYIDCIITFVILKNKKYIMCYCILNYDDSLTLNMLFSQISNQWCLDILCHNFFNQSKNYIKLDFQYWYTPKLEVTQLPLHKISKYRTSEQYQGSAYCGELDLKSDINRTDSGKLREYTTLSS